MVVMIEINISVTICVVIKIIVMIFIFNSIYVSEIILAFSTCQSKIFFFYTFHIGHFNNPVGRYYCHFNYYKGVKAQRS